MAERKRRKFKFLPLTIRLDTKGEVATPVVLRGTRLPATRSDAFTTTEDGQTTVEIALSIGERPLVKGNRRLGSFKLDGISAAKRGERSVKVQFEIDEVCTVTARVKLQGSDLSAERRFELPNDLTDKFIRDTIVEAEENRDADETALRTIEATNRAGDLIASAEERLSKGPDAAINEAVAALGLALAAEKSENIREKNNTLESLLLQGEIWDTGLLGGTDSFTGLFSAPTGPARTPNARTDQRKRPAAPRQQVVSSSPHVPPLGKVFGGGAFTLDTQLCFVLMPFDANFQPLYEDHIRPTVERAGLRCERADEIHGASVITWDIWERINRARLLVAELTDRNANVFYELGLAHAISKDVVLLTQSPDFVPFDLKALRCVLYDLSPAGAQKLEKGLAATIRAIVKTG